MRRTVLFPGLVVLVFLLVGLAAAGYVYSERRHLMNERFQAVALSESRTLVAQLKQNLAQLNAMASYFSASDRVRQAEFSRFSEGVLPASLRGQAIVWTSVVPLSEVDDFIAEIRADNPETHGNFSLRIQDRSLEDYRIPGLGLLVGTYSRSPAEPTYIGRLVTPGLEMGRVMLRAVSTGRPNISSIRFDAAPGGGIGGRPGIALTIPIFSGVGPTRSLKGLLSAFVPVPALMGIEGDMRLNSDMSYRIVDRNFGDTVIYDLSNDRILGHSVEVVHPTAGDSRRLVEPVAMINRQWTLVAEPAPGAFTASLGPSVAVVALFLICGAGVAHLLWRHRVRVEQAEAGAAASLRDVEAQTRRANRLEAELRQTSEILSAAQARCERAVDQGRSDRRMLDALLDRLTQGICILDGEARLVAWNHHVAGLLDISDGMLKTGADAEDLLQRVSDARPVAGAGPISSWTAYFSRDASATGEERLDLRMSSGLVLSALRAPAPNGGCMLILSEVQGGGHTSMGLRRKAHYDELTGLMARSRFEDVLASAVRGRRSTDTGLALVLVDIDEMSVVNDAYGPEVGDEVLAIIADILRRHIREADTAARLEGDRFALLFSAIDDVRMVMGRTEELLQAIWQPLEVPGNRLQVTANMGIAMYPNQAIDPATLMRLATDALERAKADRRRNVIIADTVPHPVGTRPSTATKH